MFLKIKNEKTSMTILSIIFVLLYGSGFVGANLGILYASPLAYLVWRFLVSTVLLFILALLFKSPWPKSWRQAAHIAVSGGLMLATFSVGMVEAMHLGVSPAINALILALQPLAVALISVIWMKKPVSLKQWLGFILGLLGVVLVVGENANFNIDYLVGLLFSLLALFGLTAGNLYQKRFCTEMHILSGGAIQSFAGTIISLILAACFNDWIIHWTPEFFFSIFWVSVVVSLGAISILYYLLRKREAHTVASLFYAVPVSAALVSYFVFGSLLTMWQIFGMIVALLGVWLVNSNKSHCASA